ncbi:Uma2 family endonuclease [Gemmata sp. JC673]|uniref:Uma2 family endonuclease n=1 Tax=Gemmata algarum TaxID=2975278 RepID=A0ABU5F0V9_9BACT|nr:Uma2 family endonuclease [Gemmata algarum]MDY3561213.1 Uma2 family endonuclease [Gemmata algarum]
MSAPAQALVTLEEYARLPDPDNGIDDLIAGRVVNRPFHSAQHGLVCGNICGLLGEYQQRRGTGSASLRCGLVIARDPATVTGPDAAFWSDRTDLPLEHGWPTRPPDAAFEVVDAGEPYSDVMRRVRLLVEFGVGVLWLVDPSLRFVAEFRGPAVRTFEVSDTLDGGDVLPGFACKVSDLFA